MCSLGICTLLVLFCFFKLLERIQGRIGHWYTPFSKGSYFRTEYLRRIVQYSSLQNLFLPYSHRRQKQISSHFPSPRTLLLADLLDHRPLLLPRQGDPGTVLPIYDRNDLIPRKKRENNSHLGVLTHLSSSLSLGMSFVTFLQSSSGDMKHRSLGSSSARRRSSCLHSVSRSTMGLF